VLSIQSSYSQEDIDMQKKDTTYNKNDVEPWDHFGFGLGINSNKLQIKAKGNDYPNINFFGDIRSEYAGVKLYASYFF